MENINTKEIIAILLKNKKAVIIITVFAAVLSAAVSFILKPKYKSVAVVYPVNLSPGSEESNTEQLLQYFNSEEVMKATAKKFDLYNHYHIDTAETGANSLFKYYFSENVKISPTLYESIEIEVKDESPVMAQNIAQHLIEATNNLIFEIKRERLSEYLVNTAGAINAELNSIDSVSSRINDLKLKFNIIDLKSQSKYLSKKLIEDKTFSEADKLLFNGIKTKGVEMENLKKELVGQIKTLSEFKDKRDKYLLDYNSQISFTNIVSKPSLPDKKCFPIRWIIVTVSSLSAFAFCCLFFILTNKSVRKVD